MPELNLLDFRKGLTGYLLRAEAGESFTITRFGEPIAVVGPVLDSTTSQPGTTVTSGTPITTTVTDASHPSRRPPPASEPQRAEKIPERATPWEVKHGKGRGKP